MPPMFEAIHNSRSSGNTIAATFADLDQGAFARCIWAWFFATCKGLRQELPEIAAAVRTGEPVQPSTRLPRVYLACTRDLQFSMVAGRLSTALTAPPFAAVLVSEWTRYLVPGWFDVALWLTQRPGHRCELALTLPIVKLIGEEALPMLGHPVLE